MSVDSVSTLSELTTKPATRRDFLLKSSVLGALSLAGCDRSGPQREANESATNSSVAAVPQGGSATAVGNADSKLDTGGHANIHLSLIHI